MNYKQELSGYLTSSSVSHFTDNINRAIQITTGLSDYDIDYVVSLIISFFVEHGDLDSDYAQDLFRKILHRMKLIGFPIIFFSNVFDEEFVDSSLFDIYRSELTPNDYNEEKRYTSQYVGHPSYIIGQYTGSVIPDISHLNLNKGNPKYEEVIDYITAMPPIRYNSPPLSSDSYRSSPRDTRRSPVRNFGKLRVRSLSPRRNRKIDRNKKTRGRSPVKNVNKRRHRSRSPKKNLY